jgi:hypothetical protein
MMDPAVATYGEENRLWTGDEAKAFARVGAIPELLVMRAERRANEMGQASSAEEAPPPSASRPGRG